MFHVIDALTRTGPRRFIVAGHSADEAEAEMRSMIEEGVMITDETGEWLKASEVEGWSLEVKGAPVPASAAVFNHFTHDAQRIV